MPTKRIALHNTEFGFKFVNNLQCVAVQTTTQEQLQILYFKDEACKLAAMQYYTVESKMMVHFREFTKLLETI